MQEAIHSNSLSIRYESNLDRRSDRGHVYAEIPLTYCERWRNDPSRCFWSVFRVAENVLGAALFGGDYKSREPQRGANQANDCYDLNVQYQGGRSAWYRNFHWFASTSKRWSNRWANETQRQYVIELPIFIVACSYHMFLEALAGEELLGSRFEQKSREVNLWRFTLERFGVLWGGGTRINTRVSEIDTLDWHDTHWLEENFVRIRTSIGIGNSLALWFDWTCLPEDSNTTQQHSCPINSLFNTRCYTICLVLLSIERG